MSRLILSVIIRPNFSAFHSLAELITRPFLLSWEKREYPIDRHTVSLREDIIFEEIKS
jgi:hypothetical protein